MLSGVVLACHSRQPSNRSASRSLCCSIACLAATRSIPVQPRLLKSPPIRRCSYGGLAGDSASHACWRAPCPGQRVPAIQGSHAAFGFRFCCSKTFTSLLPVRSPLTAPTKTHHYGCIFVGGLAGDRTRDKRLKRPLLYQLSYQPTWKFSNLNILACIRHFFKPRCWLGGLCLRVLVE